MHVQQSYLYFTVELCGFAILNIGRSTVIEAVISYFCRKKKTKGMPLLYRIKTSWSMHVVNVMGAVCCTISLYMLVSHSMLSEVHCEMFVISSISTLVYLSYIIM